jgi:hypothetical protein
MRAINAILYMMTRLLSGLLGYQWIFHAQSSRPGAKPQ